ncbi:Multi-sensor signal transduction histidine kinase [Gammaproteobacteria bacterium]
MPNKILIIDDSPSEIKVLATILSPSYELLFATNGADALELLINGKPDLILLDVVMPGMDGYQVCRSLKENPRTAEIPIIFVTVRSYDADETIGLELGADDYIHKPFAPAVIRARIRNLLARRNAELALRAKTVQLERSNVELQDFAHIVSHDLKEPLRGIYTYVTLLAEDYSERLDSEAKNYIERTQRLVEHLSFFIDRLLDYSRLGYAELDWTTLDLNELVDEITEVVAPFFREQQAELRRVGHLPIIRGNGVRVAEIFQNLLINAAKYNDKSEKWVEVGYREDTSGPIFWVRDNGVGIAAQHHDMVFRIFKRLYEKDQYGGGAGVGLTIVKKIVERHGGRIWIESTLGEGTTFYFTLNGEM